MENKVENYIDLHMHSNYSDDGDFTPDDLVRQCKEAGIRVMSITDHDSVRGNAEARAEAENKLKAMIKAFIGKGSTVTEIASIINVTEDEIITLLPELTTN